MKILCFVLIQLVALNFVLANPSVIDSTDDQPFAALTDGDEKSNQLDCVPWNFEPDEGQMMYRHECASPSNLTTILYQMSPHKNAADACATVALADGVCGRFISPRASWNLKTLVCRNNKTNRLVTLVEKSINKCPQGWSLPKIDTD